MAECELHCNIFYPSIFLSAVRSLQIKCSPLPRIPIPEAHSRAGKPYECIGTTVDCPPKELVYVPQESVKVEGYIGIKDGGIQQPCVARHGRCGRSDEPKEG